MFDLYRKALNHWGQAIPSPLKNLKDRSDEAVFEALKDVLADVTSDTWTVDAKIAWALMQGRDI